MKRLLHGNTWRKTTTTHYLKSTIYTAESCHSWWEEKWKKKKQAVKNIFLKDLKLGQRFTFHQSYNKIEWPILFELNKIINGVLLSLQLNMV
uniref:Uncharacterized protein n=1 Tax=Cyprinodon variegatus TaxID=28743 RepID=A0A3Q2DDB7_CYPVA